MTDPFGFTSLPSAFDVLEQLQDEDDGVTRGHCPQCDARWTGDDVCHCAACHMTFTTLRGFDAHRTGSFEPMRRRCRTENQLRAKGYEPNESNHWRKPMAEDQRAALGWTKEKV